MAKIIIYGEFVLMEMNKDAFPGVIELSKSIGASVQLISSVSPSAKGTCAVVMIVHLYPAVAFA